MDDPCVARHSLCCCYSGGLILLESCNILLRYSLGIVTMSCGTTVEALANRLDGGPSPDNRRYKTSKKSSDGAWTGLEVSSA